MNRFERSKAKPDIDTTGWIMLRWIRGTRYYRVHRERDRRSG
jgi:hypothetical protein